MPEDNEIISTEDHETIVGELELMHQNLEEEYHLVICVLGAIILHLTYNNWWLTTLLPIVALIILRQFIAKRLFNRGIK